MIVSVTPATINKRLIGRTITAIDWRPFDRGGRRGITYDPVFTFDDGSQLTFSVDETESHDGRSLRYGLKPIHVRERK